MFGEKCKNEVFIGPVVFLLRNGDPQSRYIVVLQSPSACAGVGRGAWLRVVTLDNGV